MFALQVSKRDTAFGHEQVTLFLQQVPSCAPPCI